MVRDPERFGVAVIRAWVEPSGDGRLKVRMIAVERDGDPGETIGVAGSIGEACELLATWLRTIVDGSDAGVRQA